jgi:mycofactocin system glycosyltransferase
VVIPVRDDPDGLAATLAALDPELDVIVVDDASTEPARVAAHDAGRTIVLRQERWRGPGAARNAGWRATTAPLVAFLDANCEPEPGWLDVLLPHFADPQVAAVAPRITTTAAPGTPPALAAYDAVRSPLDLGPREANVRPRSPVAYVPTAALVVRRTALAALDGFDATLTVGEDVDFVWRLAAAGWTVRFDPRAAVRHPTRRRWSAWLRQRHAYGSSAAPLARRHGRAVTPASLSAWSAAVWVLVAAGRPRLAGAVATAHTAALTRTLHDADIRTVGRSGVEAARLAGTGHLRAGLTAATALRRAWPPALLVLAARRRYRPALAAALVAPPLLEWVRHRPRMDPLRYAALALADDLAYAAGVWNGCFRERSARALCPELAVGRRTFGSG